MRIYAETHPPLSPEQRAEAAEARLVQHQSAMEEAKNFAKKLP